MQGRPDDLELAREFHEAMDGSLEDFFALLCDDVEWVTERRTLIGLAEMRAKLNTGAREGFESLDREYDAGEWEHADDAVVCRSRITLRWKETGEVATACDVHETVTFRDGKVARYERRGWGVAGGGAAGPGGGRPGRATSARRGRSHRSRRPRGRR